MGSVCYTPQTTEEKKRSGHSDSNGFAGHINLPDLVQQSHSPAGTPTEGLGRVSTHSQEMDSGTEVGARHSHESSVLLHGVVYLDVVKNQACVWLVSAV